MKRIAALMVLLMIVSSLCPVLADRIPPEDRKETVTALDGGYESHFRNYTPKFWDAPSEQPGTVERLDYATGAYGDTRAQWANVYLPYGYDAEKQYDILYFFHGTNETQDSFIGDEGVKNAIDNMIELGICEPFIMVFPTYYYDYEERATNHALFVDEVRGDLMPAVESRYSTYAPAADDAGFTASREHRAFSGYSQGSAVCWTVANRCMDYAKWFVPMSGGSIRNLDPLREAMGRSGYADDVFFYICTGGKRDVAYDGVVELVNAMIADDMFSFGTDPKVNNFYAAISKEIHQTLRGRFNLYNAFQDVLFK